MASKKLQIQQARLEKHLAQQDPALLECLTDLVKSRDQALNASEMKSKFLANMSHEIRTPLHGIVGTTDLLMETAQNKEQLELLQTLKISNETLLHVISDVLDFSKVEHGQLQLEERSFELGDICDSVIQLFQSTAQDKRLELLSDYQPNPLPRIVGDPLRLRQIISNLVSNALKFTLQGQVSLTVKLEAETIQITVADTGIGISEASQKTLFDAFTQADQSSTKRYGGSGLGLALCAQLAQLMGGDIDVSSQPNQGSVFTVTLPLKLAQDKAATATSGQDLSLPQHPWILLVDDNLINRKVGTRLIESLGCSAMLAENGQQAIDACAENDFNVVLMDIQMPEMDGVEAMQAIRALDKPCPPIVALTAYASVGDRERYLAAGFDDYLEKPLKKKRLWEALVNCSDTSNEEKDSTMLEKIKQAPVLNHAAYAEFMELMAEEASGLIERFQSDIVEGCDEIAALASNAPDDCRKIAHRLKSSAGYIGAERLRGLFEWLELEMPNADSQQQQAGVELAKETAKTTVLALQKAAQ